ncbi:MAG: SusC/RagA family TonB-linked outer membrane protein, partial [Tannerella sp.]|nr:SusC/RagA family TonB-linked outer membrane protein [Tannerella sp.]
MNNTFKIFSCVLLALFLSGLSAMAQDRILIRGKVINAADRSETLIGVTVAETDQDNRIIRGTTTDMNGDYSITVDNVAGRKLVFSYVGFKSQTVAIGNQAVVNMSLEEESTELGAVEIIAQRRVSVGALNISERDMTSSYSRLDARELDALPVASIDQALQGRMAGVDIVANSGQPGAGMSIRIRGTSSINSGSDPLIVVNGIPYETEISSDFDFATADEEGYSQLLNISPSDIQEITVLKDAASTAQYGSKGANGVLMIRTKRGAMGKPRITYSGKGNITVPRKPIPTLNGNQYSTLILEANMNAGTPLNLASYPEFARDPNNPYYFYNYGQNTDWVSEVQKIAFQQDHNFSLSGGGERAQYRISAGYLDEKGNQKNSAYRRFSTTTSLNYSISDKIVVVADFNYTHGTRLGAYMTDILSSSYTRMPNQSIYEYTEDGIRTPNYFSPTTHAQGSFAQNNASDRKGGIYNPVAMLNNSEYNTITDRIRPVFTLQYNILEWLNYQGTLSFDIGSTKNKGFLPKAATGLTWIDNAENMTTDSDQETFNMQITNQLNVSPKISEQVEFSGLLKFVTTNKHTDAFSTRTSNTASVFLKDPSNESRVLSANSGITQERSLQSTGIMHWKFFDKYIVQGTVNYEGNSRFGEGHRFGVFPSASIRWRVSGEPFFKDLKFLNDFSLRATYGITGNAPGKNYLYYNRYGSYDYTYLNDLGMYPESIELRDLRWERTGELDFGFNIIAFNNRVNIDFDWYKRTTDDQMFNNANIPSTSGVGSITMNVGTVENRGWELSVFTTPVRTGDWEVDFRFNLSR